jgi:ribosomal protein L7/L12
MTMIDLSPAARLRRAADLIEIDNWIDAKQAILPVWAQIQLRTKEEAADIEDAVRAILTAKGFIAAIKYTRSQMGYGLREAKDYVESLQ